MGLVEASDTRSVPVDRVRLPEFMMTSDDDLL